MEKLRQIRQGGMGIYIGTPFLAKSVSLNGGSGTVSGALADQVLVRALQIGDPGGHFRRSLSGENFPFPEMADEVIDKYFVPFGQNRIIKKAPPFTLNPSRESIALVICANYALVWLAKEGHSNPITINYLEKVQMSLIYSLVGAMLAGVDCVTIGAGIPKQVPGVLDAIARGENPTYDVHVDGFTNKTIRIEFDLRKFFEKEFPKVKRPDFIPIISSAILAEDLLRRSNGSIQALAVELHGAGGHNPRPRGGIKLSQKGEPVYSLRDEIDLAAIKSLGLPFWVGGGYASEEALYEALNAGAAGVQLGSIFALCSESGMRNDVREKVIKQLYYDETEVFTSPFASPTGFPFKVVSVDDTSANTLYIEERKRLCDLGGLIQPYLSPKGNILYRCKAEPKNNYIRKGGTMADAFGAYCLCNGLLDNSILNYGGGAAVVTLGGNTQFLKNIINETGNFNYSVKDVMNYMGLVA